MDFSLFEFAIIGLVLLVPLVWALRHFHLKTELKSRESCQNPDCIRCSKCKTARFHDKIVRFKWENDTAELLTLMNNFVEGKTSVLRLDFLDSHAIWSPPDDFHLAKDIQLLNSHADVILSESTQIPLSNWQFNNSTEGSWEIFSLINQGEIIQENIQMCPGTFSVVSQLHCLMDGCAFGNVFFSAIHPGTVIAQHTGPTNARIRCHLGLKVPPAQLCHMEVGGVKVGWKTGECLVFDDSFPHSVTYSQCDSGEDRVVLCVDFWHPQLSEAQKIAFRSVFGAE